MNRDELIQRLEELTQNAESIKATAADEGRRITNEEVAEIESILNECDEIHATVKQLDRIDDNTSVVAKMLSASAGRAAAPTQPNGEGVEDDKQDAIAQRSSGIVVKDGPKFAPTKGRDGFHTLGHFAHAVVNAVGPTQRYDERLNIRNAPTTVGTEGVGADGGFAIPPDFRDTILSQVAGEDSLLSRTTQLTTSSNHITMPADETTPWQTSGGILAFWDGENNLLTQSKPQLKEKTIKLNKLTALVPVTSELLEDAPSLASYLSMAAPKKMDFKVNLAILQGNGVGQPQGFRDHASTVSVAKVASQVADTLVGLNIINMYARMYGQSRSNAVWLINQDIEPQLFTLMKQGKLDTGAVDTGWGVPLYIPANGLSDSPYGTLFGRPVIPTQACETLGDKGDILFADLSQYQTVQKTTGLRAEQSIHLWFDYDTTAFRFIFRLGGQPMWSSTISPRDGSNTLSPFVTLDERA